MNSKQRLAINIQNLLDDKRLSRRQVADALGVKYSTFCDWVNPNHASSPDIDMISKIADYFGVRIDPLVDDEPYDDVDYKIDKILETKEFINVLGKVPAGVPYEAIENITPNSYELIPRKWMIGDRKYFGLELDGDSMSPEFKDGDTVVLLKSSTCESGNYCCVRIGHTDATFKQVKIEKDGIWIIPLNEDNSSGFKKKFFTKEEVNTLPIEIIGVYVYTIPNKVQ